MGLNASCSVCMDSKCMPDLGGSTNRTQQLGGVSHSSGAIVEGCGELGCLREVVLRVLRMLVDNT